MRALLPEPVPDVDVHAHYASQWLDGGGIRVNMVSSVDGAGSADGLSAGLQTPGDNTVFAALRDLADVVLAGSGTVAAEGYRPIRLSAQKAEWRSARGLPRVLPTAVLSRSLHLDLGAALFADADTDNRPLVMTCANADAHARRAAAQVADVVDCGDEAIDYTRVRAALAERGLTRVLCEGGPTIFAAVASAGAMDELCVSLSPMLVGPGPARIVGGDEWTGEPVRLALHGLLEDDGALFARYRHPRP